MISASPASLVPSGTVEDRIAGDHAQAVAAEIEIARITVGISIEAM
jgi:hypothetical protein